MNRRIRTKCFPPLPPRSQALVRVVLPTEGDLRLRSLLPQEFLVQLHVHGDRSHWQDRYARFALRRKFLVMATNGDLFIKSTTMNLTINDLPMRKLMPIPTFVSPREVAKVVDLVQCESISAPSVRPWELVRVQWHSGVPDSWIPIELLQREAPQLLQEFYVNSLNSWAFVDRLVANAVQSYKTEVEIWQNHPEFQRFFEHLRKKNQLGTANTMSKTAQKAPMKSTQGKSSQVNGWSQRMEAAASAAAPPTSVATSLPKSPPIPSTRPVPASIAPPDRPPIGLLQTPRSQQYIEMPRPPSMSFARPPAPLVPPSAPSVRPPAPPVQPSVSSVRPTVSPSMPSARPSPPSQSEPIRLPGSVMASVPPPRPSPPSSSSARSTPSYQVPPSSSVPTSFRPTTSSPNISTLGASVNTTFSTSSAQESTPMEKSPTKDTTNKKSASKKRPRRKRRRLRQSHWDGEDGEWQPSTSESSSEGEMSPVLEPSTSHIEISTMTKREEKEVEDTERKESRRFRRLRRHDKKDPAPSLEQEETAVASPLETVQSPSSPVLPTSVPGDVSFPLGEIHCACGDTTVGDYNGIWLQCWNEDCEAWEHAECVGYLSNDIPDDYVCSRCNKKAFSRRVHEAREHLIYWMFKCCDSHNRKQLYKLLPDQPTVKSKKGWVGHHDKTLLMKAAENGLMDIVTYLVETLEVPIRAWDRYGRNALHYAARYERADVLTYLMQYKGMDDDDEDGKTPLISMLQSPVLNRMAYDYLERHLHAVLKQGSVSARGLVAACRVLNRHTVKICTLLLDKDPRMVHQKTSSGWTPYLLICAKSMDEKRIARLKQSKEIIRLLCDADLTSSFTQEKRLGWTGLHYAVEKGNHELVKYIIRFGLHVKTTDEGYTALHIAAMYGHEKTVRVLLDAGASVLEEDNEQRIPSLVAFEHPLALRELIHYDLAAQLVKLERANGMYKTHAMVRGWQRAVCKDFVCSDVLNDACLLDMDILERDEGLLTKTPYMLRTDVKLRFLRLYYIPSFLPSSRENVTRVRLVLERGDNLWEQVTDLCSGMRAEQLRLPWCVKYDGEEVDMETFLYKLSTAVKAKELGLVWGDEPFSDVGEERLEMFVILGAVIANGALYNVPLPISFEMQHAFLACVTGKMSDMSKGWAPFAKAFADGFDIVLPSVICMLRAEELRMLLHGPTVSIIPKEWDWRLLMKWGKETQEKWWKQWTKELMKEELETVTLALVGTYEAGWKKLQGTEPDDNEDEDDDQLVRVTSGTIEGDEEVDMQTPELDRRTRTFHIPPYTGYKAFKEGMLRWMRQSDHAFLPS